MCRQIFNIGEMVAVETSVWVVTYDLPSDKGHRRVVSRFYRLLARPRSCYPGLVERQTLSTLILKTDALAHMVIRAVEMAGGRYTMNRSLAGSQ